MIEYTPTTDEVRAVWREWNGYGGLIDRTGPEPTTRAGMNAEFDRWLAARDAKLEAAVRAQIAADIRVDRAEWDDKTNYERGARYGMDLAARIAAGGAS